MKTRFVVSIALVLAVVVAALAHGDKKHVIGTVEKINNDSVVVKTKTGQSLEVKLAASTSYVSHVGTQDQPAKLSDLTVGDRVVIHATPAGDTLTADEVKFSPASANHAAAAAKPKQ